jgi:hypothetical protein
MSVNHWLVGVFERIHIQNVPSRNDPSQNVPSPMVPLLNVPVTKRPRSRNDPSLNVPDHETTQSPNDPDWQKNVQYKFIEMCCFVIWVVSWSGTFSDGSFCDWVISWSGIFCDWVVSWWVVSWWDVLWWVVLYVNRCMYCISTISTLPTSQVAQNTS